MKYFKFTYKCKFQSPRSGKFESNITGVKYACNSGLTSFQSPRSGKFESNNGWNQMGSIKGLKGKKFQSPRSGKFESNRKKS